MNAAASGRVVVVTGAATGIGAGIAEALGRAGDFVVTLDANVTLDGAGSAEALGVSTAERIVAAGGEAREAVMSVTDADAVRGLFEDLVAERGSLDAVVNVAGISRPTSFAGGSEDDWKAVLHVHLEGYLTVLRAALPLMAAAGHGRILGVTSGSGWRHADAGAYGCAKRAVTALTWQLGAQVPPGVTVNALSPIAATRMVAAALGRVPSSDDGPAATAASGGISLKGFPPPEALGPVGAYLAGEEFSWCTGRVLFSAGAEIALVAEPRPIEIVRSRPVASLAATLSTVVPGALVRAEAAQATGGGAMARFADAFDADPDDGHGDAADPDGVAGGTCLVVAAGDGADASGVVASLERRGASCRTILADAGGFAAATAALRRAAEGLDRLDAVVLATGVAGHEPQGSPWENLLADHDGLPGRVLADAAWMRAVADHSTAIDREVRIVAVVDATTPGGRSRAQAASQLSRAALGATDERVAAAVVSVESAEPADRAAAAEFAAHLAVGPDAPGLSGAELCVGRGWIGLRSHPHPAGTVNFGGPELPDWVDQAVRVLVGAWASEQN